MKLTCHICGQNKSSVTRFDFIDAQGDGSPGNVCDECVNLHLRRPDGLICMKHKKRYFILIDNTSACAEHVQEAANADIDTNAKQARQEWAEVVKYVTRKDKAEFLKLIRTPTEDNLPPVKCWRVAVQLYAMRYSVSPDEAVSQITKRVKTTKSLVIAALPSSDPKRKYIPKP